MMIPSTMTKQHDAEAAAWVNAPKSPISPIIAAVDDAGYSDDYAAEAATNDSRSGSCHFATDGSTSHSCL